MKSQDNLYKNQYVILIFGSKKKIMIKIEITATFSEYILFRQALLQCGLDEVFFTGKIVVNFLDYF